MITNAEVLASLGLSPEEVILMEVVANGRKAAPGLRPRWGNEGPELCHQPLVQTITIRWGRLVAEFVASWGEREVGVLVYRLVRARPSIPLCERASRRRLAAKRLFWLRIEKKSAVWPALRMRFERLFTIVAYDPHAFVFQQGAGVLCINCPRRPK